VPSATPVGVKRAAPAAAIPVQSAWSEFDAADLGATLAPGAAHGKALLLPDAAPVAPVVATAGPPSSADNRHDTTPAPRPIHTPTRASVNESTDGQACSACGTAIPSRGRFCPACGNPQPAG